MNFVHISILAGLGAAAIPMVLHMMGRRQPQLVDFPALRFVKQTQLEQSTSWKLRHFLLLLLRVLLLAVMVFALARPRVHSASMGNMIGIAGLVILAAVATLAAAVAWASRRPLAVWVSASAIALMLWLGIGWWSYRTLALGPTMPVSDTTAPVAVGLILDTSPTMNFKAENQTRLEVAKEMSTWLLDRFPIDSHVGIFTDVPIGSLSQSPQGAATQVSRIERTTERIDLLSRMRTALDLILADELERKELYIVTDMNAAAWGAVQADLSELIQQHKDQVLIQIVDVGVQSPVNWQLGDPKLDFNSVPTGGDVTIRIPVSQSAGKSESDSSVTVELWQEEVNPKLPVIERGKLTLPASAVAARSVVNVAAGGTVEVELTAKRLAEGVNHFRIRLDKSDPLAIDNERYFSVVAQEQQPTLVVSNNPEASKVLQLVLDPQSLQAESSTITTMTYSQLSQAVLTRYSVIVLFDPGSLAENVVQSLKEHVMGGGGLLIIMGAALEPIAANLDASPISQLLPGQTPTVLSRPPTDRSAFWNPTAPTHPVYQDLEFPANEIAWQLMPIFRSWNFGELKGDVQLLATLVGTDAPPLLTSQSVGHGQILALLTPIPEFEKSGTPLWNELWVSEQYWWAFGILSGSVRTLSGASQAPLTFVAGAPVTLPNDTNQWPKNWELYTPAAERVALEASNGVLVTGSHAAPGNYHLRGNRGQAVARGFSVNIPAADTMLTRIDNDALDALLGRDSYHVARQRDEVETSVGQARFGKELYPLLMLFVAGIFLAEQVMSNRFYKIQLRFGKATT